MGLRLVMMGTGPFAVPTLEALYQTRHTVAALVTQPARGQSERRSVSRSPMRDVAQPRETPVLDPDNVNCPEAQSLLVALRPDLLVVADYGQILSAETLGLARWGGVNLHGSLLPKYRGAAPINWALYHGDAETGVTVIQMTSRIDAGPCLAQARTPIGPEENALELEARLARLGAPLVCQTVDGLETGEAPQVVQDASQACPARRLRKTDGLIDWRRSAREIFNQIRALEPWPRTYTFWRRGGAAEPLRLIPGRVQLCPAPGAGAPGECLQAHGDRLVFATGEGALAWREVQPAGKRMLSAEEFLRGYPLQPGHVLGGE